MDRALWLLLWLRLCGWLRRLKRALSSVRGVLLGLFGLLIFASWVLPPLLVQSADPPHLEGVRRFGPLALILFCVLNLLLSSGERGINFSPAEVNLLFPAPFSRRQLLLYKIVGTFGGALLTAAFLTVFTRQHTASLLAGFVGLTLTILFLQLFSMALALFISAVGASAYNRRRKMILAALVVVLAVAFVQAGGAAMQRGWLDLLAEVEQTPVVQTLLTPVSWFIRTSTAEQLWPDLVLYAALGLGVNLCLLLLVFTLDAQYLEASAVASERLYARLQQVRRGGAAMAVPSSRSARLSLPMLPYWGGVGPLAWRQLTTALRSLWSVVLVLMIFGVVMVPSLVREDRKGTNDSMAKLSVGVLVGLALFVPPMLPFDFRGDIDRIDVLKTLPLPGWRLALGQLLAPVLLVSLVQLLLLAVVQALGGDPQPVLLAGIAFLLPINFLLFGLENLFFLWFPTRLTASGPGDFQTLGRQMVLWIAKLFSLGLVVAAAFVAGLLAYYLGGESWLAGGLAAWVCVTAAALGLLPLIALAFRQFDVTRDTPP